MMGYKIQKKHRNYIKRIIWVKNELLCFKKWKYWIKKRMESLETKNEKVIEEQKKEINDLKT